MIRTRCLNLIHIDDAARAVAAALAAVAPDAVYLVSDDRPVTRREYYSRVAKLLGSPAPRFAPSEAGGSNDARDATNKRVANQRMKARLGVDLIYPDITTGLPAALAQIAVVIRIDGQKSGPIPACAINRWAPARRSSASGPSRCALSGSAP